MQNIGIWLVEVFFRQAKDRLAFDRYQLRSSQEIRRFWLISQLYCIKALTKTTKKLYHKHIFTKGTKENEPHIYRSANFY